MRHNLQTGFLVRTSLTGFADDAGIGIKLGIAGMNSARVRHQVAEAMSRGKTSRCRYGETRRCTACFTIA